MPLITTPKNAYTAKVASVTYFEDTKSLSILAVIKTKNGKPATDLTVSFNLSEEHPLAQGLYDRTVSEVGFLANGFSPEAVRGTTDKPIHAIVGMQKVALAELLSSEIGDVAEVTDEAEAKRKSGPATRAMNWIRDGIKSALEG